MRSFFEKMAGFAIQVETFESIVQENAAQAGRVAGEHVVVRANDRRTGYGKAITFARNGNHVRVGRTFVTEQFAEKKNMLGEVSVRDDLIGPHAREEYFFAYDPAVCLKQQQ